MKPRPILVQGDIAVVPLSGGHVAIIDAVDVPLVAGVNWSASPSRNTFYASRTIWRDGKTEKVILHRLLMAAPADMHVDHRDGDGLNCRRNNMRLATVQQNNLNRGLRVTNKCGLKGVSPQGNRFRSEIQADGTKHYLGLFATPEQAHAIYCETGKSLHGEFWRPT